MDLFWIRIGSARTLMPNLSIKDVPEDMTEALRQRAARNHRSLQGELMAILEQALRNEAGQDEASRQARRQRLFEIMDSTREYAASDRLSRDEVHRRK